MRVLVACEYSGTVRDAFIAAGHEALSCDLLPTEKPGPHYQGDVRDVLADGCTGLRLKNLPPLVEHADAAEVLAYGRTLPDNVFQRCAYLPPSPTRWIERSRTFPGIAAAMAAQWGTLPALTTPAKPTYQQLEMTL